MSSLRNGLTILDNRWAHTTIIRFACLVWGKYSRVLNIGMTDKGKYENHVDLVLLILLKIHSNTMTNSIVLIGVLYRRSYGLFNDSSLQQDFWKCIPILTLTSYPNKEPMTSHITQWLTNGCQVFSNICRCHLVLVLLDIYWYPIPIHLLLYHGNILTWSGKTQYLHVSIDSVTHRPLTGIMWAIKRWALSYHGNHFGQHPPPGK